MDGTFRLLSVAQNQFFRQAFIGFGERFRLELHFREQKVFRTCFYHHTRVAPFGASVARTHTVDYQLVRTAGCRYDKSTGTHAEAVHSSSVYLLYETVFGGRKVFSSSVFIVILYLVNQHGRVFQSHTDGNSFGFQLHPMGIQPAIYISGRMSGS